MTISLSFTVYGTYSNYTNAIIILLIGETLLANRCSLVVDGIIVNEAVEGFIEGIMLMFASYYIFNIAYPEGLAATLEFIQR